MLAHCSGYSLLCALGAGGRLAPGGVDEAWRAGADQPAMAVLKKVKETAIIALGAAALTLTAHPAKAEIRLPPIDRGICPACVQLVV